MSLVDATLPRGLQECQHTNGACSGYGDVTKLNTSRDARAAASSGLDAAAGLAGGRFLTGEAGSMSGTHVPASSLTRYRHALRARESPVDCSGPGRGDALVKVEK